MKTLAVQTERKTQLLDVTNDVRQAVAGQVGEIVTLFVPHTTAGIVLQASGEGAVAVAQDVEFALERIVNEGWEWTHTEEGDQNPWAHVRAALTGAAVMIPLVDGDLALGDYQAIFFCEFDGPRSRSLRVVVH